MRIIAGSLGGLQFNSPHGHRTHPMSDKMRGALFNALGDIRGLSVVDLYAGSGAVAFEAISRGAREVIAVEADKKAHTTILENIDLLGVADRVHSTKAFVHSWMNRTNKEFDVVIADPPYDDLDYKTLDKLHKLVKPDGILVYSLPPMARLVLPKTCEEVSVKDYGDSTLAFYRRIQ